MTLCHGDIMSRARYRFDACLACSTQTYTGKTMKIIIFTLNTDQLVAVPESDTLAFLKQYVGNVKAMNECTFIKMETQEAPVETTPEPRRRRRRASSQVGAFIKSKRKEKKLNQTETSVLLCAAEDKDVHITQSRISAIERGKSKATVKQFVFMCTQVFDISQEDALELVSKYRTELK